MGAIPSVDNMPSVKFQFPFNNVLIEPNITFTIKLAISKLATGYFVNAYYSAPQTLNDGGDIKGHSHVVIEKLESLFQIEPTDPRKFVFFKGLNAVAQDGILSAEVTKGLEEGVYRMASITTPANHQPVLMPVAQHGSIDDIVYVSFGSFL